MKMEICMYVEKCFNNYFFNIRTYIEDLIRYFNYERNFFNKMIVNSH